MCQISEYVTDKANSNAIKKLTKIQPVESIGAKELNNALCECLTVCLGSCHFTKSFLHWAGVVMTPSTNRNHCLDARMALLDGVKFLVERNLILESTVPSFQTVG